MLSDNIRYYRKEMKLSQDELAEKIGVSRQSVSFWENGQTQPTIDNIIALTKIFHISSDMLLGTADGTVIPLSEEPEKEPEKEPPKKSSKAPLIIVICLVAVLLICIIGVIVTLPKGESHDGASKETGSSTTADPAKPTDIIPTTTAPTSTQTPTDPLVELVDLFALCKRFAIENGHLNGDYCIYQQPATNYGGYDSEYFSITYWSDSDKVEFCLHCPLSETQSHNFYLTMRGGYTGTYEYSSSKYYRDTGESFRYASGYIDPGIFYDGYPIPCDVYEGSFDGQDDFMEQTRVGICDLIRCMKQFVVVEDLDCDFSAFGFKHF